MTSSHDDPTRWKDGGADTNALQDRAAALVRAAGDVPPLGPEVLSRIRTNVVDRRAGGDVSGDRRWLVGPTGLRPLIVAVLLLVSITTAGGASLLLRKYLARPRETVNLTSPPVQRVVTPPARSPRTHRPATPAQKDTSPRGPIALVDPGPSIQSGEHPHPHLPPRLRPKLPAASEAHLLAEALLQLRQQHDPRGALATLGRYDLAFPHAVLASEALSARLEATIALGDFGSALALLDGLRSFSDPSGEDLLLTRGELRANAGRCRDALADFNRFLEIRRLPPPNRANERALYGRAVCFGVMGDDERARADLIAYRRYFPTGRFASEVARLLDGK